MSRPRKWRHVCSLPEHNEFGPLNAPRRRGQAVILGVDEYETIRLIDHVGFTQAECAAQMNVARTTVQKIYSDARKKVAEALVNGRLLIIEGGDYRLCDGESQLCDSRSCFRQRRGRMNRSPRDMNID
ncbi:MAG: DUF134 domain-containing protein [Firmicutes bacterium]|nr:DUF134 domain-containing protein [Bacillota bacterium]